MLEELHNIALSKTPRTYDPFFWHLSPCCGCIDDALRHSHVIPPYRIQATRKHQQRFYATLL